MKSFLKGLLTDHRAELEKHRGRPFLKAAMAACSLAASADGEVCMVERIQLEKILTSLDELKLFDQKEGIKLFVSYADAILKAPRLGREKAMAAVNQVTSNPETAALLVRLCLAVVEAKGGKKLVERIEIMQLCSLLKVDPKAVGLIGAT